LAYLALDPTAVETWDDDVMRNARNIGHFGMGDTEYSLRTVDQLDELKALIQTAYDARA
jgi:predicted transport protein